MIKDSKEKKEKDMEMAKKLKFVDLKVRSEIHKAIEDMGFEEPTPIQAQAIPHILAGKDVIGQAQTGTGKTVAFGIPLLENIDPKLRKLQALVLCPTRELAIQVAEELKRLSKYMREINILPVYGGQPIDRQIHALAKGVSIIIGTPGRVMDHMDRGTLKLDNVKFVVLDEADRMLDMGFVDDMEFILSKISAARQSVLFSATMPGPILELTKRYQKNPYLIKVVHTELTAPNIEQFYYDINERMKVEVLTRLIDIYNPKLSLIFSNTKQGVDELVEHLQARGYSAEGLHGDMRQSVRDRVMGKFRKGLIELLVATDVAARGIDVDDVDAVFNYDLPKDVEYYVHRIGRTARAGKSGKAFTFVVGREIYKLRDIQRYAKIKINHRHVPSVSDVAEVRTESFLEKVKAVMKEGKLEKYAALAEELIGEEYTFLDVAAALFKMSLGTELQSAKDEISSDFNNTGAAAGMVRLFINIGRSAGIGPRDIVAAITGQAGISARDIGAINIFDRYSFAEVPKENAADVLRLMKTTQINGRSCCIALAIKK